MKCILVILLSLFIYSVSYAQQREDWKVLFNGMKKKDSIIIEIFDFKLADENNFGFKNIKASTILEGLYLTNNGGNSFFKSLESNPSDSFHINIEDWQYVDNSILFLLVDSVKFNKWQGLTKIYDYQTYVYKSTDGGDSWEKIQISEDWRSRKSQAICMTDEQNGILVQYPSEYHTNEDTDQILITNDGWNTWTKINVHPDLLGTSHIRLFPPSTIVARNWATNIFVTGNSGKNWTKKELPSEIKLTPVNSDFYIYDDKTFFIDGSEKLSSQSGYYSLAARSTDAGDSWDILIDTTGLGRTITSLSIINEKTIYIHGGTNLLTSNGGDTWEKYYDAYIENFKAEIHNIFHFSENRKLAIASRRYILGFFGDHTLKAPDFVEPASNYELPLDFTLEWTPIEGATHYEIEIVQRPGVPLDEPRAPTRYDTVLFVDESSIYQPYFKLSGTDYFKEYSCRIRAANESQTSQWNSEHFTTAKSTKVNTIVTNAGYKCYPNPASDYIKIDPVPIGKHIEIISVYGEKVKEESYNEVIDISKLPPGIYGIRLCNNKLMFIKN